MQKDCFGDFKLDKLECDTCSQNLDCFTRAFNKLPCFSSALLSGVCLYSSALCDGDITRCNSVRFILRGMKNDNCFMQVNQTDDKCLECQAVRFCEVAQAIKGNISLSVERVTESIKGQLKEMEISFDTCFKKYEFDEECHKNCDFLIQCRKESNILPGSKCKMWISGTEKNYDIVNPCDGINCLSVESCRELLLQIHEENRVIDDKMKVYRGFLTLDAIRDATEVGDG